jgi:regulator of RNase E activity RraB
MDDYLFDAIKSSNIEMVKDILNSGINPNIRKGYTIPLIYAIQSATDYKYDNAYILHDHMIKIIELLLERGADPNFSTIEGNTALIQASMVNEKEIVNLLLNNSANPNLKDNDGDTALINAVYSGNREIIEILLNAGADPTIKNNQGETAYDIAIEDGMDEYAEDLFLLLKYYMMMYNMQRRRRRNLTYKKKRTQLAHKNLALSKLLDTYDVDEPSTRDMRRETIRSIMDY